MVIESLSNYQRILKAYAKGKGYNINERRGGGRKQGSCFLSFKFSFLKFSFPKNFFLTNLTKHQLYNNVYQY